MRVSRPRISAWIGAIALILVVGPVHGTAQMRVFEPGIVSTVGHDDLTPSFSPDGGRMVFARREPGGTFTLYESFRSGEGWSNPEVVPFSGSADDQAPSFSPDGRWLFFQSRRGTASAARDDDLWRVPVEESGWGAPIPISPPVRKAPPTNPAIAFQGREMAPSVDGDGTLFYWSALPGRTIGESDIYLASPEEDGYGEPRNLGRPLNSEWYETHPWISPAGSYLLFSCDLCPDAVGASDVYVSRRAEDGWTTPVNLGSSVNSYRYDFGAFVSPDGRHLYVSSNRPVPGWTGDPVQNIWRIRVTEVPALSFLDGGDDPPAARVEYLANEGVLIEADGRSVLIDGLFGEGLDEYARVPPARRDSLERALGRYGDIDLVMVTHVHRDHFDAGAAARHLRANPDAIFIGPGQAVDSLRVLAEWVDTSRTVVLSPSPGEDVSAERKGFGVTAVGLSHPPSRNQPVQHVAYLVTAPGARILHLGDSSPSLEEVQGLPRSPDLLLAPFWAVGDSASMALLEPHRIASFHFPSHREPTTTVPGGGIVIEPLRLPGQLLEIQRVSPGHRP